ncbi:MAG: hypothetical protein NZ703_08075 [Gemmataceae bacterium]|nr:hypothetical protein [Gemmataceae bacterium]MCS7271027.1 hypothetical protein [Gemmataceae bacterium]MDW8244584.1 hypothetical protein [Thermogemmata sp.]
MGWRRSQLGVELLEDRSVPAGVVNVIGASPDNITIVGDNLANDITISMSGNGISIQANGTTTLTLSPNTPGSWVVSQTPTLIVLNPNGPNNPPTLGNLFVDMRDGDDVVGAFSLSSSGNQVFSLGNGNDKLNVGACNVGGALIVRDITGNDTVTIDNTRANLNSFINLTSGNDKVYIAGSGTAFNQDLMISMAAGDDLVRFIPGQSVINGNLGIYTGAGNDRVLVDGASPGTPATLKVNGNTLIQTGSNNDRVIFGTPGSMTGATVDLAATVIDMGSGKDEIGMRDAIMSLLIALLGDDDDQVLNNWGAANVTVGFGSLLDGGNQMVADTLPSGWSAPAGLSVVGFP